MEKEIVLSQKSRLIAAALVLFLGVFGVHRFYVGKIGTGFIQLLTGGGFLVWMAIDLILIVLGEFSDKNGKKIGEWL